MEMPCLFTKGHRYAVAFSGGLDSTVLLYGAHKILGDDVVAMLGVGANFPGSEQREAEEFCVKNNIPLIKIPFDFTAVPEFVENGAERCYYCKRALFSLFKKTAEKMGAELVDGTNLSDEGDYRPGRRAAEEIGVKSPFLQAGMGKAEIRALAKQWGLGVWQKPSMACLASRIAYGKEINADLLQKIDGAETEIRELGYAQVRLRVLSEVELRVELEPFDSVDEEKITGIVNGIFGAQKKINFARYKTGCLNNLKK